MSSPSRIIRNVRLADPAAPPAADKAAAINDQVLFEDKNLLVVNKPGGIAVHGGSGVSHGVIELLRHARPELRDLSLVHRLDRETSGCLVLAKRRSALRALASPPAAAATSSQGSPAGGGAGSGASDRLHKNATVASATAWGSRWPPDSKA